MHISLPHARLLLVFHAALFFSLLLMVHAHTIRTEERRNVLLCVGTSASTSASLDLQLFFSTFGLLDIYLSIYLAIQAETLEPYLYIALALQPPNQTRRCTHIHAYVDTIADREEPKKKGKKTERA